MSIVVAVDHRFDDLTVESEVLERVGATVQDARGLEREAVLEMCADADAILIGARFRFDAAAVARLSRCKVIVRYGIGYDNVDVDAAAASGIWVAFVPDYCIEEVADHAIALLLAMNRRLGEFDRGIRAGEWGVTPGLRVRRLSTCAVGVVGFGRIGEAFARRALALGMVVLAHDPHRSSTDLASAGVIASALDELLATSDFVSLHAPPPEDGRPLIGGEQFESMKRTAVLINVGRAALVDEVALVSALRAGRLGGAALDVTAEEPLRPPHPLLETDRILLTPHAAWYSLEAVNELRVRAAEEAARVIGGGVPLWSARKLEPAP